VYISITSAADACSGGGASGPFTIWGNNSVWKNCTNYYDSDDINDPTIGGFDWYAHRDSNQYARIANNGEVSGGDQGDCP
jgi:hypothetical protein